MWTVTRQHQWPDGGYVVEISSGNFNYCNPGVLGKYAEYANPVEAVEAAIEIAKAWKKDTKKNIMIGRGATGGYTNPFDGQPLTKKVFAEFRAWAEKRLEALPKCEKCEEPILGTPITLYDFDDYQFCREYCAEEWLAANYAEIEEDGVNV